MIEKDEGKMRPMLIEKLSVEGIPSLLWSVQSGSVYLAVHGSQSHKGDDAVRVFAEAAAQRGVQTLSFDLPEHGDRPRSGFCRIEDCMADLKTMMRYARAHWAHVGIFACSMGAYFSLLATEEARPEQCLFLSPVVNMRGLIEEMMTRAGVARARLEAEKRIEIPGEPALDWAYYQYVVEHPVAQWTVPTAILCGEEDMLDDGGRNVAAFCRRFGCTYERLPGMGHWFHTPTELAALREWSGRNIHMISGK